MFVRSQHRLEQVLAAPAAPLVMLPGTLCDARLFGPLLDVLGLTAAVPELSGAETAADVAGALLTSLPDRFALCGFSLGAIVALEIAAQAPERVERLALIGCNPGTLSATAAAERAAHRHRGFIKACLNHAHPAAHALIEEMARHTARNFAQQTQITLSRADSWPRLQHLGMPVLILCGAEDRICPPALSIQMARAIPQARLAVIAGAGHYVTLEQPQAVADEINAWLSTPNSSVH